MKGIIKIRAEISEKETNVAMAKFNKMNIQFLKTKINDNVLARMIKKHKVGVEKNHSSKIRSENGEMTKDNTVIQKVIRDYCEQLYVTKMDNLEEMETFLRNNNSS